MIGVIRYLIIANKIARLEKKQARPLREIANATLSGEEIPDEAKKRLLELEGKIQQLRNGIK